MIRFIVGILTVIAGVAAIEGTAGIGTGALVATIGVIIMLWGVSGMDRRNLG